MHIHPSLLRATRDAGDPPAGRWQAWLGICLLVALTGCGGTGDHPGGRTAQEQARGLRQRPETMPVRLDFLYVFENRRDAPYYPIEGIGGVEYAADGTLIFCDEKGARVHGRDPQSDTWFEFDSSPDRPYQPVDCRVDGFSYLVLDMGGRLLLRYDQRGVYQDRLLSFRHLDTAVQRLPTAFDVDRDGRLVVTDASQQQILVLDAFLNLAQVLGDPGSHGEQFSDPSGIVFLPDGGFVVADRGNRRLQTYSRLAYFEGIVGGEFDLNNPMITPQGIDCDVHGNLFVADPAASAVHVYSRQWEHLFSLGSDYGLLAGPERPMDVAVGPDDLMAVADRGREAVLVYRIVYQ